MYISLIKLNLNIYLMVCLGSNAKCVWLCGVFMMKKNSCYLNTRGLYWISFLKNMIFCGAMTSNLAGECFIIMAAGYFIWSSITILKCEHDWYFNFFIIVVFHLPNKYSDRQTGVLRSKSTVTFNCIENWKPTSHVYYQSLTLFCILL